MDDIVYLIRGKYVLLDSDLAMLFESNVRTLDRLVSENPSKFSEDSAFYLNDMEKDAIFAQNPSANINKKRKSKPLVFTKQGVVRISKLLPSVPEGHLSDIRKTITRKRRYRLKYVKQNLLGG